MDSTENITETAPHLQPLLELFERAYRNGERHVIRYGMCGLVVQAKESSKHHAN